MITRIIQLVVAPVVMISACAIFTGGLLSRYAAINDRLRAMNHERLEIIFAKPGKLPPATEERLAEIDNQIPMLIARHRLAHNAVLAVYSASALFIIDMFGIALAAQTNTDWMANLVLIFFLIALTVLLLSLLYTAAEVRTSNRAIECESTRVMNLIRKSDIELE